MVSAFSCSGDLRRKDQEPEDQKLCFHTIHTLIDSCLRQGVDTLAATVQVLLGFQSQLIKTLLEIVFPPRSTLQPSPFHSAPCEANLSDSISWQSPFSFGFLLGLSKGKHQQGLEGVSEEMSGYLAPWLLSCHNYFAVAGFLYPEPQLLLDVFSYIFSFLLIPANNSFLVSST